MTTENHREMSFSAKEILMVQTTSKSTKRHGSETQRTRNRLVSLLLLMFLILAEGSRGSGRADYTHPSQKYYKENQRSVDVISRAVVLKHGWITSGSSCRNRPPRS